MSWKSKAQEVACDAMATASLFGGGCCTRMAVRLRQCTCAHLAASSSKRESDATSLRFSRDEESHAQSTVVMQCGKSQGAVLTPAATQQADRREPMNIRRLSFPAAASCICGDNAMLATHLMALTSMRRGGNATNNNDWWDVPAGIGR